MAKKAKKSKTSKRVKRAPKPRKRVAHKQRVKSFLAPRVVKHKTEPFTPLPADQLRQFREMLTKKRDDLTTVVQRKKEEEIEDMGVGDEADVATRSIEKEILFELTDSEKQTLDKIEAALLKMEKGVYGACESCQNAIPRMRLQVMPWARYCVDCQAKLEVPSES